MVTPGVAAGLVMRQWLECDPSLRETPTRAPLPRWRVQQHSLAWSGAPLPSSALWERSDLRYEATLSCFRLNFQVLVLLRVQRSVWVKGCGALSKWSRLPVLWEGRSALLVGRSEVSQEVNSFAASYGCASRGCGSVGRAVLPLGFRLLCGAAAPAWALVHALLGHLCVVLWPAMSLLGAGQWQVILSVQALLPTATPPRPWGGGRPPVGLLLGG